MESQSGTETGSWTPSSPAQPPPLQAGPRQGRGVCSPLRRLGGGAPRSGRKAWSLDPASGAPLGGSVALETACEASSLGCDSGLCMEL